MISRMRGPHLVTTLAAALLTAVPVLAGDLYALCGHVPAVSDEAPEGGEIVRIAVGNPIAEVVLDVPPLMVFAAFDPITPRMFLVSRSETDKRLYVADLRARTLRATDFDAAGATFAYDVASRRLLGVRGTDLLQIDAASGEAALLMSFDAPVDLLAVDGGRQRAYVADRSDEEPTTAVRVVDLVHGTTSAPLTPPRRVPSVVIDADGGAFVVAGTEIRDQSDIVRIDPLTSGVTTLASSVLMGSHRPAIDARSHLIYGISWSDWNLSTLIAFDLTTRVSKVLHWLSGDSLDLGIAEAAPPIGRTRAVRVRP